MTTGGEKYLAWIRRQACCGPGCTVPGGVQAHHETGAGMGIKADDKKAIPLCMSCHRDFHDLAGRFKGWKKHQLRDWQTAQVLRHNIRYKKVFEDPTIPTEVF